MRVMDGAVGDEGHPGARSSHYSVAFIPHLEDGVMYLTMPMEPHHVWMQDSEEWVREIVYVNIATNCDSSPFFLSEVAEGTLVLPL